MAELNEDNFVQESNDKREECSSSYAKILQRVGDPRDAKSFPF